MSRFCEICGAPIGSSAGICQSCGVAHEALGEEKVLAIGQPRWGVMHVEFPSQAPHAGAVIDALRAIFCVLEESSFQKLAPTQLHLIVPGCQSIDLVGPYSSFTRIQDDLEGQLKIIFFDKTPSEIDDLLQRIPKAGQ